MNRTYECENDEAIILMDSGFNIFVIKFESSGWVVTSYMFKESIAI